MIVNERIASVTPEHGVGGGLRTTANTPPAARDAATSAIMTISIAFNVYTFDCARIGARLTMMDENPAKRYLAHMVRPNANSELTTNSWAVVYDDSVACTVWVGLSSVVRVASGCRRAGGYGSVAGRAVVIHLEDQGSVICRCGIGPIN